MESPWCSSGLVHIVEAIVVSLQTAAPLGSLIPFCDDVAGLYRGSFDDAHGFRAQVLERFEAVGVPLAAAKCPAPAHSMTFFGMALDVYGPGQRLNSPIRPPPPKRLLSDRSAFAPPWTEPPPSPPSGAYAGSRASLAPSTCGSGGSGAPLAPSGHACDSATRVSVPWCVPAGKRSLNGVRRAQRTFVGRVPAQSARLGVPRWRPCRSTPLE